MSVTRAQVDAVLDSVPDGESPSRALVELLDANIPSWSTVVGHDRGSVVESSGAFWAVRAYDGGPNIDPECDSRRCATYEEACAWIGRWFS